MKIEMVEQSIVIEYDDKRLEFICIYHKSKGLMENMVQAYQLIENKRIPIKNFSITVSKMV